MTLPIASKTRRGYMGPEQVRKLEAFGFLPNDGGTVTQATSKSTGVTLNKRCGSITMHAASLAANTSVVFVLSNDQIGTSDVLVVNLTGSATYAAYMVGVDDIQNGLAVIHVRNVSGGSLGEAIVLGFAVIKVTVA